MIQHNELTIDGVRTSSFPYKIIVKESPVINIGDSKTTFISHRGISGYISQTNKHREVVERKYTIHLVKPTEQQLYEFKALLSREGFWLENEQVKLTKWWCYRANKYESMRDEHGIYTLEVTFVCHPTHYMKQNNVQILNSNGAIQTQGSALAFPKITVLGNGTTQFTVGRQVIKLENLREQAVMINDPANPSFKDKTGNLIKWSGDFITLDPTKEQHVGVVFGAGIQRITFETLWGWV